MTTLQTALTVAATATASGTLAAGKHTPVDASGGSVTMILPVPARAGAYLRVERVDAAVNTVSITGVIRGATTTLTLLGQYDQLEFFSESTNSWRIEGQHRPKAIYDALYAAKTAGVPAGGTSTTFLRGDGTWAAPTGTVVAGQELTQATYWPSSGTQPSATTVSSTAHDIAADGVTAAWTGFTATSLDCTFTVPPSRVVDVRVELYCKGSAAGTSVRLALGDNTGTTLAGPNVSAVVANGTVEQRVPFTRRLDLSTITGGGPAAGASFTLRPQWLANSGTGTIDVGGTNGPISMRVYAAM